jgi:predicted alpha-1,2-mannosidase
MRAVSAFIPGVTMMHRTLALAGLVFLLATVCMAQGQEPVELVNPLNGTASTFELSHGNTYPAIALPWGMNFWTPQTGKMGNGWAYSYYSDSIRGLRQTHQPSPWINDYGAFSMMPVVGTLKLTESDRASKFSHSNEVAKPYYYSVLLETPGVKAEIAPAGHAAVFRYTYPRDGAAYLVIDAFHKGSEIEVLPDGKTVRGIARNNSGGVPANFGNYFVLRFSHPISAAGTWVDGVRKDGVLRAKGAHTMAFVRFDNLAGPLVVNVASSFIGPDQALLSLEKEIGSRGFDEIRNAARSSWADELNRFVVEGGTAKQRATFYSCLYRVLLFPRNLTEYDHSGKPVYYSPYDGRQHEGYMYTDNGFWDTFRAVHPFFTLFYPELSSRIMQSLVNAYKESGWLPEWASPGHRDCMIGNHSISLIADAYMKGIRGFDTVTALEAMQHQANGQGPVTSVGRNGFKEYNEKGYVPYPEYKESTARTLEYAYNDFCLARFAEALGRKEIAGKYYRTAGNYRNVFSPEVGFMRGRKADGAWVPDFDPTEWGGPFTEGNSWHYTWSVFHDIEGLSRLLGGHAPMAAKLDALFAAPNTVKVGTYGTMIHEMTEMVNANMGQYAHGNQPIQHMIYLYNYVGEPWKTQRWVRTIMDRLYGSGPDAYCGDEDNGQTSAWYVMSALGFYPVCPGVPQYAVGSPLFAKATLRMPEGKALVIEASGNDANHPYLGAAALNGKGFSRNWLGHDDLRKGGNIRLQMNDKPNTTRGTRPEDAPFSMTR